MAESNSGGSQKSANSIFSVYCFLLNRVGRKFRFLKILKKFGYRTSLVVPWIGVCLPVEGTQV